MEHAWLLGLYCLPPKPQIGLGQNPGACEVLILHARLRLSFSMSNASDTYQSTRAASAYSGRPEETEKSILWKVDLVKFVRAGPRGERGNGSHWATACIAIMDGAHIFNWFFSQ